MISEALRRNCARSPERQEWLDRLPGAVARLVKHWDLALEEPFAVEGEASWVRPVTRRDGTPAVLKLGMPHFEADHEAAGLRFWSGDPTIRLLEEEDGAMLLERCKPGTPLNERPEPEQDEVLARCLRALWRPASGTFRPLSFMIESWIAEAPPHEQGIETFRSLLASSPSEVLLATDLHAGNVLASGRQPWLVIDPKPFVGDPAYDATQHLLNCPGRMSEDPLGTIARYADLLGVDRDRVRRWLFARLTAAPGDERGAGWDAILIRL